MDKLKELLARCKCGVYLVVNEHRDVYESAADALKAYEHMECPPEIDHETIVGILKAGTIIDLQFYPDTPIGSYKIVHYDLDAALTMALECAKQ